MAAAVCGTVLLGLAATVDRGGTEDDPPALAVVAMICAAGPMLLLLGTCVASPVLVAVLRPVARAGPGSWRLAGRSLVRQRSRTSAMLAAICATAALAVAASAVGLASEREDWRVDDLPEDVVRITSSGSQSGDPDGRPEREVLEAAGRRAAQVMPDTERLDISAAVVAGQQAWPTFQVYGFEPADPADRGVADDVLPPRRATIVDDAFRRAYGVDAATQRLLDAAGAVWSGPADGRVLITGSVPLLPATPAAIMATPSFTFGAAAVGPGHARGAGSSGELLVTPERAGQLGTVAVPGRARSGGPAAARRSCSLCSGGRAAVPLGLMPVAVVARLGERLPLVVPWRTIGLLLVAAPLLAAAVTTVAARLSLRLHPVRLSTATLDPV